MSYISYQVIAAGRTKTKPVALTKSKEEKIKANLELLNKAGCRQEAASPIALMATPSLRGNPTVKCADGNARVLSSQDNVGKSGNVSKSRITKAVIAFLIGLRSLSNCVLIYIRIEIPK